MINYNGSGSDPSRGKVKTLLNAGLDILLGTFAQMRGMLYIHLYARNCATDLKDPSLRSG